jgi:hypothetical protein
MDSLPNPESFATFVSSRCIAYVLSLDELGMLQAGYGSHGCNCYSAGESLNNECILPSAWPHMLAWLDKVYKDPEYVEQIMIPSTDVDDENSHPLKELIMSAVDDGQLNSEDAEDHIATGEECKADDLQVGGLIGEVKGVEPCLKPEDVSQSVQPAVTKDEVLAKVKVEDAAV